MRGLRCTRHCAWGDVSDGPSGIVSFVGEAFLVAAPRPATDKSCDAEVSEEQCSKDDKGGDVENDKNEGDDENNNGASLGGGVSVPPLIAMTAMTAMGTMVMVQSLSTQAATATAKMKQKTMMRAKLTRQGTMKMKRRKVKTKMSKETQMAKLAGMTMGKQLGMTLVTTSLCGALWSRRGRIVQDIDRWCSEEGGPTFQRDLDRYLADLDVIDKQLANQRAQ